jgi:hypothetical protein
VCCRCGALVCRVHDQVADLVTLRKTLRSLWRRSTATSGPTVGEIAGARFAGVDAGSGRDAAHERRSATPGADEEDIANVRSSEPNPLSLEAIPVAVDGDQSQSIRDRHFCSKCVPIGTSLDPVFLISLAVVCIGAMILPANTVVGLALIGLSVFRILGRLWIGWRRRRSTAPTLELFLDPRIVKVDIVETLTGRCELSADRIDTSEVQDVTGHIEVEAMWTRANNAVAQKRMRQIGPAAQDLRVTAGTLVLAGEGQLTLRPSDEVAVTHPSAIQLRPRLADHDVLFTPSGRGDPRWKFTIPYDPTPPAGDWRMPLWLTPSFAPDSDRRALELRVQWRSRESDDEIGHDQELLAKELTSIVIWVPSDWGEVTRVETANAEQCTVGGIDENRMIRQIEWHKPNVSATSRGICRIAVAFDQRIDVDSRITGNMLMKFDRTLSGAIGADIYASGGARRRQEFRSVTRTDLRMTFDISLVAVRYQAMLSVPERGDDTADQTEYQGVAPDHNTVGKLVEQLSNDRYYVKSVVENPPRSGSTAPIVNRVWDISGRRYHGLHPTDFRLVLTGEEPESEATGGGSTRARLSVKGAYASDKTERRIRQEYERLRERIDTILSQLKIVDEHPSRYADDSARTPAATLTNILYSVQEMLADSKREGTIPPAVADGIIDHISNELGDR